MASAQSCAAALDEDLVQGLRPHDDELLTVSLFKSTDFATIRPLLRSCPVRTLGADEVLIAAGRPNRYMYVVLSGLVSVRLSSAESAPITEIGPGEIVGEMSAIDHRPTSAFVVACEPTRVLAIDEELMWMLVNTSHAISTNLLFMLTHRLRAGNEIISRHHEQMEQYQYHATVDALTGLFNRHWLGNMLPRQMHRSRMCDEPFCVLMIDIDHFKNYNDEYGHVAGDAALRIVSDTLRESLRPTDMAARFGGEEFLVLLPACSHDGAEIVAERLRAAVEHATIDIGRDAPLPCVTVSVGIGVLPPAGTVEEFVGTADAALYRAKAAGRNRVCV